MNAAVGRASGGAVARIGRFSRLLTLHRYQRTANRRGIEAMSFSYSDFAAALKAGAPISAEDVLAVRRWVWPDGCVSSDEAEALFELNRSARASAAEWGAFFIEGVVEHVVNHGA